MKIISIVKASKVSGKIRFGYMVVRANRSAVVPLLFERLFPNSIDMIIPQEHMVETLYTLQQKKGKQVAKDYNDLAFGELKVNDTLKNDAVVFDPSPCCSLGIV